MNVSKFFMLCFPFLFFSCEVINPEEDIPAYIEILPFNYNPGNDGIASTNITDGWIYVDGEFFGVFDLPKTIPVLKSGTVEILLDPGIKENAINATPNVYLFYERYITSVDLVVGETVTIQPVTTYDEEVTDIIFQEEFNSDANTSRFDFEIINTNVDAKEGGRSGLITMNKDSNPSIGMVSDALEMYPANGNVGYLEMDYKGDAPILVGVIGYDNFGNQTFSELPYGVKPTEVWKKAYFNFTEIFSLLKQQNSVSYKIRIGSAIPIDNGEFTLENAEIRLDNIKLVTF